jgi:hypothetical protein
LQGLTTERHHVARTSRQEFPAADETLRVHLMNVRGYAYHRGPSVSVGSGLLMCSHACAAPGS